MYGNKKKSYGAKSGLYGGWLIKSMFWVLKNAVVWADVWEHALSWWRVIRPRRLVFLIYWKITGKQMVVYHLELTVLRCFSGTIATCPVFPRKQAIICLEALRARVTSAGFDPFETPILLSTIHHLLNKAKCEKIFFDKIFLKSVVCSRPRYSCIKLTHTTYVVREARL